MTLGGYCFTASRHLNLVNKVILGGRKMAHLRITIGRGGGLDDDRLRGTVPLDGVGGE